MLPIVGNVLFSGIQWYRIVSSCLLGRRFVSGPHHDGDEFPCESFDGPGGRLAHTCMPELKNAAGDSF